MVGVAEDDLGLEMGLQIDRIKSLDRPHGAHGHEDGCLDRGVGSHQRRGTCVPVGGFDMECHYGIILIIKCKIVPKKRKMQNILILADGINAERFIERIAQKRIGENYYTVVAPREIVYDTRHASNLELRQFDPTSLTKLRAIFKPEHFSLVFIVMDTDEEARASWDNVRQLDAKIPIVLLDRWGSFSVLHESATHVVDEAQLVASRLFDHLPNVPVVAQNVGLAQGEIMEVLVSYGSSFAYRHIGSIPQNKWKIAAIYREQKLILPTNATMIRPQDTLLIIGKPQVLLNIYHRISKKEAEKHWKTYPDLWDGYGAVDGNRDGWWSVDEVWGLYPGAPIFWW